MKAIPPFDHLQDHPLASGTFTVTPVDDREFREAVCAPSADQAHPAWAYIATQRGIGIGVAELCALVDFDMADGPMLGSVRMEFAQPIELGRAYRVTGEVLGVDHKEGRRTGPFDILAFRERLLAEDGSEVASSTNTFILPRRITT
ncbi:MAG: hypothetical protein JWR63_1436 [Conexibacter sp.]|nr:hypothetical protein [Conexibacter sp.]